MRQPSGTFRLSCLGPGQLQAPDGRRIPLRTRKHLALLLILGLRQGRLVSRDRVIELLWSEDGERAARHSLSQSVSLINKAIGVDLVAAEGSNQIGIATGALWLDVVEFESLAREGRQDAARALWRGTLLDGFWLRRAPAFEQWLGEERGRLERLMRRMAADLIEQRRQEGDHTGMRAEAEALLALDSLDEAAMLACLQALTLAGERTLALRRYGEFEKRLKAELDAEPGASLRTWARRHRRSDSASFPVTTVSRVHEIQTLPAVQPLFGRVEEYRQLWEGWERATVGSGSFWIIEGEAGIGKTALAGKLANQVHVSGASVCFVKCYRTEKSVPFAPISALIRQLARLPGFMAMNPSWIGELTRLVPELRDRFPHAPPPMGVDDSARFRLCDAAVHATECVADEQPLLIVVDDIHDADEATLALLHYLGRQVGAWPALLATTARFEDRLTDLERAFFQTAKASALARFVRLDPLDGESITKLVMQVVASNANQQVSGAVDSIVATAMGNPLLAIEAALGRRPADGHAAHATRSFDALSNRRLLELSSDAQIVAATLALVGRPLALLHIGEITDLASATLVRVLEELEAASFVRKSGNTYGLSHERYQAAIDQRTPATTRTVLHGRIARFKARSNADDSSAGIEVAKHFALAGRNRRAVQHALAAAHYARSLGAVRERATALELASALSGRHPDQLLELADCHLYLKDFDSVRAICSEITREVQSGSASELEASFLQFEADQQSGALPFGKAREVLARIIASNTDFPHRIPAFFQLVRIADKGGDAATARYVARELRAVSLSSKARNSAGYRALATGFVISRYHNPRRALVSLETALREARRTSDWELELVCRDGLGAVLKQVGRFADSAQQIRHGLEFARKTLNPQAESIGLSNLAVSEMALGRLEDAARHLRQAARIDDAFPQWPIRGYRMLNQGVLQYHRADYNSARSILLTTLEFARDNGLWAVELASRGMLGMCAVRVRDDAALATQATRLLEDLPARRQFVPDRGPTEAALAWHQVRVGDPAGGIQRLAQTCAHLRRRDMDHWMFAELERIRLVEHSEERCCSLERARLRDIASGFGADGFAQASAESTP